MSEALDIAWTERSKLRAEGNKLRAEGDKLRAEGNKLYAERSKLYAEGNKLSAEGNKLYAEGDLLWVNAVLAAYGNITITWLNDDGIERCELGNGEVYRRTPIEFWQRGAS